MGESSDKSCGMACDGEVGREEVVDVGKEWEEREAEEELYEERDGVL